MTANLPRDVLDAIAKLAADVSSLQASLGRGSQPALPTSTTHPSNPTLGQPIYETDTGLTAYWNGAAWAYPPQLIGKKALTAATPSITLPVPAGPAFNTLRVAWNARSDSATTATYMLLQLNGDTNAAHYDWDDNQASGATPGPAASPGTVSSIQVGTMAAATATAGYLGVGELVIPNAAGANFKGISAHSTSMITSSSGYSGTYGGLWLSTAAVTSITLFPLAGNFAPGSAAYLYGET